ncbi:MAG: IgA Peptidase M64 [Acidobacteriia bacterium]|nr:IgA Peptidase M64 [Terriglobia bacterium]
MRLKFFFILLAVLVFMSNNVFSAPATMRLDYYHTGNASHEVFSVDRIVIEPLPWPGNVHKTLDDTNLGKYYFEVIDRQTNRVLYSRGFASVFGEWETTDEAKTAHRTFQESVRFPAPVEPVQVILKKRDPRNAFQQIWSVVIDPHDSTIDTAKPPAPGPLLEIQKSGDSADKVDFLILGDGYTVAERPKFEKDARRLADLLFATPPFKEHRRDFNVWALCPAAAESGISRPSTGIHRRSPLGASYDAFGSERYILTFENRAFRDIASWAPYEFVEILVNGRTYGGGGIFGLYSTVAADSLWSPYVFIHEFGHHFAGLADEYYTSPVAYETPAHRVEPWEPNVTALLDPDHLKWKDLVSPGTPVPTPWNKEAFEKYSREIQQRRLQIRRDRRPEPEMDALFQEEKAHETELLGTDKYSGKVGAFEGALYEAKGYYRPQTDCIMFTRDDVGFCAVCRRAIERIIALYTP